MRFRLPLPALVCGAAWALGPSAWAEDPFLGQIKEIKCVNCQPGWVTLVIHDPIDVRDFELYLKDVDYNRIITPLPGKRIHDRGDCFYWFDRPKAKKAAGGPPSDTASSKPGQRGAGAAPAVAGPAQDSAAAKEVPIGDSAFTVPPPSLDPGTPSACIRYYRQIK